MISRIHINQANLRQNHKDGGDRPVVTVATYKGVQKYHEVTIEGPSKVIYGGEKPLSCGARIWIETTATVKGVLR